MADGDAQPAESAKPASEPHERFQYEIRYDAKGKLETTHAEHDRQVHDPRDGRGSDVIVGKGNRSYVVMKVLRQAEAGYAGGAGKLGVVLAELVGGSGR